MQNVSFQNKLYNWNTMYLCVSITLLLQQVKVELNKKNKNVNIVELFNL